MTKSTRQTVITDPSDENKKHRFTFDFSYSSFDPADPEYCSQQMVWEDIGVSCLTNAYEGYNVSLFAYGQTGSGKSYSMMGYPATPLNPGSGIIPIACTKIFDRITDNTDPDWSARVEMSMLEIYMEKIKDLFAPTAGHRKLRVHPAKGPYVEGLTTAVVKNFEDVEKLMEQGTAARTVAATNMNATSSRAHTIFQIVLTQTKIDRETAKASDTVSVINLIDLAGSERAGSTGATGDRLKEGAAINQSLSALGNVISTLAKNSSAKKKTRVPYRDSVLTTLLMNALGGNAKTVMIAALSPASVNYDETLSTLRYADRAKQIKNKAVKNEDPNMALIAALKAEIEQLRATMGGQAVAAPVAGESEETKRLREQLEEAQRLLQQGNKSWAEKEAESKEAAEQRALQLSAMGAASVDPEKLKTTPHITNLNEDPLLDRKIIHVLEAGETKFGRDNADTPQDVTLRGPSIQKEHCVFTHRTGGKVTLRVLPGAKLFVNGTAALPGQEPELASFDRIIIGNSHVFYFRYPGDPDEPDGWEEPLSNEFAVRERTQKEFAALEEARRKEAEEEQRKMQEKMRQLEEEAAVKRRQFEEMQKEVEDRQRALAEQDEAKRAEMEEKLREEREAMLQRQRELEEQLKKQVERTEKLAKRKEQEHKNKSLLDEKLMRLIPMVNEANTISHELGKGLKFSIKLVAVQDTTSVLDFDEELGPPTTTDVKVRVDFADATIPRLMWDHDKFVNRLYLMREMYQDYEENDNSFEGLNYTDENDPFYDPPDAQLIGRAQLTLEALAFLLNWTEPVSIIDDVGRENGKLDIEIVPHLSETPPPPGEVDTELELNHEAVSELVGRVLHITIRISGAKGIPRQLSSGVFATYKFFLEADEHRTETSKASSINPALAYEFTHKQVVTDEFVKYLETGIIYVEVYGMSEKALQAMERLKGSTPAPGATRSESFGGAGDTDRETELLRQLEDQQRKLRDLEREVMELRSRGVATPNEDASVACSIM